MKIIDAPRIELLYAQDNLVIPCEKGQISELQRVLDDVGKIDRNKDYEVVIRRKKRRRSLNANNYSWVLTDQLADKLNITKDECHRLMLTRYGQTAKDKNGNNLIISALATIPQDALIETLGYIAPIKSGWVGSKEFIHYRILKGSSEFDTKEMSIFLDGIISECKEQGIETATPDELARMKAMWGEKKDGNY